MTNNAKKESRPLKTNSSLIQIEPQDQEISPFPYLNQSPDPALVSQGWQRRFMVGPDRLEETHKLYLELGYEVHHEPVKPAEFNEICQECQTLACDDYVTIYTRPNKPSNPDRHE
jgi:hypothetical protein